MMVCSALIKYFNMCSAHINLLVCSALIKYVNLLNRYLGYSIQWLSVSLTLILVRI